jgi:hypothetical protein
MSGPVDPNVDLTRFVRRRRLALAQRTASLPGPLVDAALAARVAVEALRADAALAARVAVEALRAAAPERDAP